MTIIFSTKTIEGLDGVYANPAYFDGNISSETELVITDREDIAKAAKSKGIKVKGFTKQPPKEAEVTAEPKPSADAVKDAVVEEPVVKRRVRKPKVKKDN